MLFQLVVSLMTISVSCSTRYLKTTVKTASGGTYPIPPIKVGTRFKFSGVYKGPSVQNMASFSLWSVSDEVLGLQLRFNYDTKPFQDTQEEEHPNYFLVTSTIGKTGWADNENLGKRYAFPMTLVA